MDENELEELIEQDYCVFIENPRFLVTSKGVNLYSDVEGEGLIQVTDIEFKTWNIDSEKARELFIKHGFKEIIK